MSVNVSRRAQRYCFSCSFLAAIPLKKNQSKSWKSNKKLNWKCRHRAQNLCQRHKLTMLIYGTITVKVLEICTLIFPEKSWLVFSLRERRCTLVVWVQWFLPLANPVSLGFCIILHCEYSESYLHKYIIICTEKHWETLSWWFPVNVTNWFESKHPSGLNSSSIWVFTYKRLLSRS